MKIKLLLIFIFQFACIMEIKDQNNDAMVISNFNVEYDQIINEILFQLTTPLNHDLIERVYVKMIKDDLSNELVFTLNDLGTSGDIIASNGIFSGIFSFQEGLSFGKYEVERVETTDGFKFFFDADTWLMIRPSGTEPVLRTYAEASTQDKVFDILADCKATIL